MPEEEENSIPVPNIGGPNFHPLDDTKKLCLDLSLRSTDMMTFNCPSNGWKYQFTGRLLSTNWKLFKLIVTSSPSNCREIPFSFHLHKNILLADGAGSFNSAQFVWTVFLPAVIYLELFDHSGVSHNCQQLPTFCLSCKSKVSLHLNVQPLCGWSTVWSLGTKGTDASPSLVTATHARRGSTSWRYLVFPFFQTCGRSNNKVLTGS